MGPCTVDRGVAGEEESAASHLYPRASSREEWAGPPQIRLGLSRPRLPRPAAKLGASFPCLTTAPLSPLEHQGG